MKTGTLLVVDDDPQVIRFVARAAREVGYEVVSASTAKEVWEAIDNDLSLVLLDLDMPDTDGLAILRELAERRFSAPIHIFSGADAKILRSATRLGEELGLRLRQPLPKPLGLDELRRVLTEARGTGSRTTPPPSAFFGEPETSAEELREGIQRGELFLVFQPILELSSLEPRGAEALVRWRHPVHGIIPPLRFVPLAERSGLVDAMTDAILGKAFELARRSEFAGPGGPLPISVNLAPAALTDRALPRRIVELLAASQLEPQRLKVEVTESIALADRLNVIEVLSRLSLRGIEISIDDFGTGSSSLERLDQLPCSELKIERAFVGKVLEREEARAIVRSTIELGKRLGLRTVAEGIESAAVLEWLREAGCDWGQGYYFARGLEPEALGSWLAGWRGTPSPTDPS